MDQNLFLTKFQFTPQRLMWVGLFMVYLLGLFSPLIENDSAQFAVMAMRMAQENDYLHLIKGFEPYLDKPHMHFWLSALSFELFGFHHWAYRLPSLLMLIVATVSIYRWSNLFYNTQISQWVAFLFASAQTIILSGIDVRTDAVLVGFVSLALYQFSSFIETEKKSALILGSVAAAFAFSTKGQIALLVIGIAILVHLSLRKKWKLLVSHHFLLALFVFSLCISPMLYAYYIQFDQHPELIIRGQGERTGLKFIFWEQSMERLSGEGLGKNSSNYFFFVHSFLWEFLPWTVLFIGGLILTIKRNQQKLSVMEVFPYLVLLIVFPLISMAQFKLPHYLNVLMPLFALATAKFIAYCFHLKKTPKSVKLIQLLILLLYFTLGMFLFFGIFEERVNSFLFVLLLAVSIWSLRAVIHLKFHSFERLLMFNAIGLIFINLILNTSFYPKLAEFQAGYTTAKELKASPYAKSPIYKLTAKHSWALDFYHQRSLKLLKAADLDLFEGLLYVSQEEFDAIKASGKTYDLISKKTQFSVSRLNLKFLNPKTREQVTSYRYLLQLTPSETR